MTNNEKWHQKHIYVRNNQQETKCVWGDLIDPTPPRLNFFICFVNLFIPFVLHWNDPLYWLTACCAFTSLKCSSFRTPVRNESLGLTVPVETHHFAAVWVWGLTKNPLTQDGQTCRCIATSTRAFPVISVWTSLYLCSVSQPISLQQLKMKIRSLCLLFLFSKLELDAM